MTLLSFQFNFHFDFSGLLCILVCMACLAIGVVGEIIGLFMRGYYKEMNPQRLPLSEAVIYGSLIPLIGAGLSLLFVWLSNTSGGGTGRTFREGMDAMSIPAALISLALTSAACFALTEGWSNVANYCDSLSPFHIVAFFGMAILTYLFA